MKKKLPLSIFEIVSYSILLLLGIWGLVYVILGITVEFGNYKDALVVYDKALKANTAGLGFLYQGFLIMGVAIVPAIIILLVFAKRSDRDFEKAQRRAARLAKSETKVVEAEAEPVKE